MVKLSKFAPPVSKEQSKYKKPSLGILPSIGQGLFPAVKDIGKGWAAPIIADTAEEKYGSLNKESDDAMAEIKKLRPENLETSIRKARDAGFSDQEILGSIQRQRQKALDMIQATQGKSQRFSQTFEDTVGFKDTTPVEAASRVAQTGLSAGLLGGTIPASVPLPSGTAALAKAHPYIAGAVSRAIPSAGYGAASGVLRGVEEGEPVGKIAKRAAVDAATQAIFNEAIYGISQVPQAVGKRLYAAGVGAPKKVVRADVQQGGQRVETLMNKGIFGTQGKLARVAERGLEGAGSKLDDALAAAKGNPIQTSKVLEALDESARGP